MYCIFLLSLIIKYVVSDDFKTPLENFLQWNESNRISNKCYQQLQNLDKITFKTMIDASAKIPEGVLHGNFYHLGNFEECYGLRTSNGTFGRYCLGQRESRNRRFQLQIGICIPNGCNSSDAQHLTFDQLTFTDDFCYSQSDSSNLGAESLITIIFLCACVGGVVASTAYDLALQSQNKVTNRPLLVAFSLYTNGRKLLKTSTDQAHLPFLNGLRSITMFWIVLGHVYLLSYNGPIGNIYNYLTWKDSVINMLIEQTTISVDTFLYIGGLVTVYAFLKHTNQHGGRFNVILYYLHRYIRLTPALALLVLIHATLANRLAIGPLWGRIDPLLTNSCKANWWAALLYIQNFVHDNETCVPQTWYLSVDFQLFLVSPLVLVPLKKWPKSTISILVLLVLFGSALSFVIAYIYRIGAFFGTPGTDDQEMMWIYYKQTYTRYSPYAVGMISGYFTYKIKGADPKTVRLSTIGILLIWALVLTGLLSCIFGPYNVLTSTYDRLNHSIIIGTVRTVWALCLTGLVLMCTMNYGGFISTFLSLEIFQILSKLSYSLYLVHYIWIMVRYVASTEVIYFSNATMLYRFCADSVICLLLSVILCLTFESPMITIEKVLFSGFLQKSTKKTAENQENGPGKT